MEARAGKLELEEAGRRWGSWGERDVQTKLSICSGEPERSPDGKTGSRSADGQAGEFLGWGVEQTGDRLQHERGEWLLQENRFYKSIIWKQQKSASSVLYMCSQKGL